MFQPFFFLFFQKTPIIRPYNDAYPIYPESPKEELPPPSEKLRAVGSRRSKEPLGQVDYNDYI